MKKAPPRDWLIAIPTYSRAETLAGRTLPILAGCGVPADRIHIYLSDPTERPLYEKHLTPGTYGSLRDGKLGVGPNRNHIIRDQEVGTRLVCVDDDIHALRERVNEKTTTDVTNLPRLIKDAFMFCDQSGAWLWGIYPANNPFFMNARVRQDLCYIPGALYGLTVRNLPTEMVPLEDKEDFERSIKFYEHDGALARYDYITLKSAHYKEPGGMQVTRTKERVDSSAHYLARKYPQYTTLFRSKTSGYMEVRLSDKTLKKTSTR